MTFADWRCFLRIQLSEHFTFKKLLLFVAPSVVMMVFTNIYTVVDGLFIARYVGGTAVAAINYVFPFIFILGSVGFMLGAGGSALVSKTLGEGDKERANAYFSMLVYVTVGVGFVIAVTGALCVPYIVELLGVDGLTYEYCVLYGRVLLASQPLFILQNIFQSFFVTAEKPKLGLVITACAGLTNIILDAVFVAGFGWGLAGAAAATVAGQVVGGVIPVIYFACRNGSLLRLTATKLYFGALFKSCANGSSEFLSNVAAAVVTIVYNHQLRTLVGDAGVTAYGTIMYVVMVFYSVFMGYAIGSAPLIGYHYGAENKDELRNLFCKSLLIISVAGLAMTAVSEGLAAPFISIFGYEEELFDMSLRGFRIYSVAFLITGFNVFASSMFTALNNGLVSGILAFGRTLVFQVVSVFVFPLFWQLDGVWSAIIFAELMSLVLSAAFTLSFGQKYGYMGRKKVL